MVKLRVLLTRYTFVVISIRGGSSKNTHFTEFPVIKVIYTRKIKCISCTF